MTLRKHFDNYKVVHKLTKPKSPMVIEFLSEPKEDWFVEVIRYKRTDEVLVSHSIITKNQVADWIERFSRIMKFENAKI